MDEGERIGLPPESISQGRGVLDIVKMAEFKEISRKMGYSVHAKTGHIAWRHE
jgi:hypothetical protein